MRVLKVLPLAVALVALLCTAGSAAADTWYSVANPIDPQYLSDLPYGATSDWIQQWRSYLYTPPATTLANGMGVNFNVDPSQAAVTARLLAASGIKQARVEISWSSVAYSNQSVFENASDYTEEIQALREYGIKPLILLNANDEIPGPTEAWTANLTAAAPAGARTVQLDAASAAQVIPGYSGLNNGSVAAGIIFTSVNSSHVATLSQPLPSAFAAGSYPAATLAYQPFAQPELADGAPNPQFQATLQGWLGYVRMTMNLVTAAYGSSNFDVEIWNELGFGSSFLDLGNYYNPLPVATEGDTISAILDATVAFLKNPANGWSGVRVGDGFTNQTGGGDDVRTLPAGLDAIDKHPYSQLAVYPDDATGFPVDALGLEDFQWVNSQPVPNFSPSYYAFMPEYDLTGINTDTLTRMLAPFTTVVGSTPLGANVADAGGTPPAMWITEDNMDPTSVQGVPATLTQSDYDHIHAKAALRTYISYIGKGVQSVDLYAVDGAPRWNLVDPAFFTAAQIGNTDTYSYPGAALAGPVMAATGRLAATLAGAQTITTPHPLSLLGIANDSENYQFAGNGTAAFPPLYDREVLNFQPFQLTETSWVAAVYVMTRDIAHIYNQNAPASDPTRTDMPPENFQITIGGLDATDLTASATDPLTGVSVPVSIISRNGDVATIQLPVTDSPRMVTLTDPPANSSPAAAPQPAPSSPLAAATTPLSAPLPTAGHTKAAGGSSTTPLSATSSVVLRGRAVFLDLRCSQACRVSWSLQREGRATPRSAGRLLLVADRVVAVCVEADAGRANAAGSVAITISALNGHATLKQRRAIG